MTPIKHLAHLIQKKFQLWLLIAVYEEYSAKSEFTENAHNILTDQDN